MSHDRFLNPGRLCCALLFTLPLTMAGAWAGVPSADKIAAPEARPKGLSSLPAEAQWSISAALGRDQPAYHAKAQGKAWRFQNPKHGLRADFTARGMEVRTATARLALRLSGLGRGARLEAVATATPEAQANRVEYRRGGLTEWYVNGPLGLEQGFTLDGPPAEAGGEALTLSLRLAGGMTAVPGPRGDGVVLQAHAGSAWLRYRGLAAWDATGRALSAWWQAAGPEVRLRVDDTGARYPVTIDPIIEDARLIASDVNTLFGNSVAVDGDTVVVGASDAFEFPAVRPGSAYVFVKPQSGWAGLLTESAKLTASDGVNNDGFGLSVAVSGATVLVGATTLSDFDNNFRRGSAYVFVRPAGGWAGALTENAKLTTSDGVASGFGYSVAVSDDTIAVAADGGDTFGSQRPGSAYVFVKPAGGWAGAITQDAKLTASDGAEGAVFASSVAVSGETVVAGAPQDVFGSNTQQGCAYVFVKPAGGWAGTLTENAKLTASDGRVNSGFGGSVAIDVDTTVAISIDSGYVFVKPAGGWAGTLTENAKLIGSRGEVIDFVAMSGDTVVTAADDPDFNDNNRASAFVFKKPAGGWGGTLTEDAVLLRSDTSIGLVGVSGDTVVSAAGSVSVFEGFEVEAKPATTRIDCKTPRCTIHLTCTLPPELGTPCTNQIKVFVRARDVRLSDETQAKASKRIRFAFGVANIPPGQTGPVKIKPTPRGRTIIRTSKKRRFAGFMEITNAPGTAINRIPIRIKLR